jgi:two-component system chemotaxis response regulator CheY
MSEPPSVLVVEDDDAIRDVLEAALVDEGYAVRAVRHGKAALDVLRASPPDVVLLDLMLPVLDGWGFLEERLRLGLALDTRVIVLSASRRAAALERERLVVWAVVAKPFELDDLLATIDRAAHRSAV